MLPCRLRAIIHSNELFDHSTVTRDGHSRRRIERILKSHALCPTGSEASRGDR